MSDVLHVCVCKFVCMLVISISLLVSVTCERLTMYSKVLGPSSFSTLLVDLDGAVMIFRGSEYFGAVGKLACRYTLTNLPTRNSGLVDL